jgi:hypothetical protein
VGAAAGRPAEIGGRRSIWRGRTGPKYDYDERANRKMKTAISLSRRRLESAAAIQ